MVRDVHTGRVVITVSTAEAQLAVGGAHIGRGEAARLVAEVPLALGAVPGRGRTVQPEMGVIVGAEWGWVWSYGGEGL